MATTATSDGHTNYTRTSSRSGRGCVAGLTVYFSPANAADHSRLFPGDRATRNHRAGNRPCRANPRAITPITPGSHHSHPPGTDAPVGRVGQRHRKGDVAGRVVAALPRPLRWPREPGRQQGRRRSGGPAGNAPSPTATSEACRGPGQPTLGPIQGRDPAESPPASPVSKGT